MTKTYLPRDPLLILLLFLWLGLSYVVWSLEFGMERHFPFSCEPQLVIVPRKVGVTTAIELAFLANVVWSRIAHQYENERMEWRREPLRSASRNFLCFRALLH
jgi:hypothetical protein